MKKLYKNIEKKLHLFSTYKKLLFVSYISKILLFIRALFGKKSTLVETKRLGLYWKLDLTEAIDCCLYAFNNYEPELLRAMIKTVPQDAYFIDIGANIGAHTLPMAKHISKGFVYAIEPTDFAFNKLQENIHLNADLKNISLSKTFLSSSEEAPKVNEVSSSWNIKDIKDQKRNILDGGFAKSLENTSQMTFDSWVQHQGIEKIDFIKLDVDGFEVDVLKGAEKTLKNFSPTIFIELSPIHFEGHKDSFSDIVEILKAHNYKIKDLFGNELVLDTDFLEEHIPWGTLLNVCAYK